MSPTERRGSTSKGGDAYRWRRNDAATTTYSREPATATADAADDLVLIALAATETPSGRAAYDRLVARHRTWLVAHLTRLLRNEGDAQDVVQETFTRAYLALRRKPPDRSFGAWLKVMATRLAYNQQRDARTRRRYHGQIELGEPGKRQEEGREFMQELLRPLHPGEQEVLILRYVEEWSVEEIAGFLGIGTSAAKMRLMRARKALHARHDQLTGPRAA